MNIWISFFILFFSFGKDAPTTVQTQSLNGAWQFSEKGKNNWQEGTIPGTVQTDLLALNAIPHPFKGTNEDSIQWISERDWTYKKTFTLSKKELKKQKHYLQFKGLDTYAEVFLNDKKILDADNAFRTWEVEVADLLKKENELVIHLHSIDAIEEQKAAQLKYKLPEAPRVFTRKPQFQYGWDWGPTIKTLGVWREVSLISYDAMRILDVFYKIENLNDEEAKINTHLEIESAVTASIAVVINNETTQKSNTVQLDVKKGKHTYQTPLNIENPKRWWIHDLGTPFLYEFNLILEHKGETIDTNHQKIGLRTIELVTEKDDVGESFYFKLNGRPVYMKGANYIPQNIFLHEVNRSQREQLLNDVLATNMNMLRVWGGGVYEEDIFYELCDEKGILIWQDFMFACAMYPGDEAFLKNVKIEAVENVKRLRKHPSIALWCGNNENNEGWHRWGWQMGKTKKQKKEIWGNYQKVFNDLLPQVVKNMNPNIDYWESSPKYGRGDKRYQFEGDAHDWWVWHDGYPFEHFEEEVPRFMSEFGFQAFPSYEAIQWFTGKENFSISDPSFATHQKHSRGFKLIQEYMERDFTVPTAAADYVYVSQLVQAHGISKGIYAHRRAKPYNMGTLYWQLNDCWPVVSWSSIDGLGNWKALNYYAQRAFQPLLIAPYQEDNILKIKIVDDQMNPTTGNLKIEIKDFEGNLISEFQQEDITTNNEANEVVFKLDLLTIDFSKKTNYAEITYAKEKAIHYFVKPKDLNLKNEPIKIDIQKIDDAFEISLYSNTLQKDVFLYPTSGGFFSDNYFDLLPNEKKIIYLNTDQKDTPKILYKTLKN